jgi:GAF domain-containing protein
VWLQSPTPQSPPTRVAGTGGYDRFLLTFSKLELPERVSCFETLVHFQGKMGLLIRQCDQFCEAHDMFGLFCQMRDVCRQVLEMPHARLWQIDRERNSALCLYNNTVRGSIKAPVLALDLPSAALLEIKPVRYCSQAEDAQNGRLLPFLGCFPGEVARSRKVVICNDATSDSRFQSWQYREMQDETNEPLVPFLSPSNANTVPPLPSPPLLPRQGTIIGVALLDAEERCKHVFECYRPEPAATAVGGPVPPCLDGADAFLLQALGDYAGAAAVAIRQRWEQVRVAQLPAILLASDSFAGFISRLREFLKEWFSVLDVEIFMYDDANASRVLWVYEDRAVAANMDKKTRTRSVMDRVVSLKVPTKRLAFGQQGLALEIAKQSIEGKGSKTHITDNAPRDAKYFAATDCPAKTVVKATSSREKDHEVGGAVRQLLTTGLWSSSSLADKMGRLVAVLQLRDREWQPGWRKERPEDKQLAKFSGFTTMDASWMDTLKQPLTDALESALRKEETRLNKLQARVADRRAQSIMTITNAIAQGLPTEELFATVVREVISLLNCDRATMWLLTPNRDKLWSMVAPVGKANSLIRLEVPISNKSLSGSCVLNDEVINLPNAYDDARFDRRFDKQTGYTTRSMLMVPITSEQTQDVLGCLQCLNKQTVDGVEEGVVFEQSDIELSQAFTSIAAVAIVQSKLEGAAEYGVGIAITQRAKDHHHDDHISG